MDTIEAYKKYYFEPNQEIMQGLALTHTMEGLEGIEKTIESLDLDWYEKQYYRLEKLEWIEQTEEILASAYRKLPPCELFSPKCFLLFGYNTMTGAGTFAKDQVVMAIGLEHIAAYSSVRPYQDLLVHELHHLVRLSKINLLEEILGSPLKGRPFDIKLAGELLHSMTIRDYLVTEGLAGVAPAVIAGEHIDDKRIRELLFYKEDQLKEIKERESELWEELQKDLYRSDQEARYKWCMSPSLEKYSIPERALYYLGAILIIDLLSSQEFSFADLTTMKTKDVVNLSGYLGRG